MVVSGKIERATSSPHPWNNQPRFEVRPTQTYLGGEKFGGRVFVGIVGGNVDEAVNVVLSHCLRDALCAVDMHVGV